MTPDFPLDIASCAANLTERQHVVAVLGPAEDTAEDTAEPSAFDRWRTDKLADKLAERFQKESARRPDAARHTRQSLADLLTRYHRHTHAAGGLSSALGRILTDMHGEWLPTYRAALEGFTNAQPTAIWRVSHVHY